MPLKRSAKPEKEPDASLQGRDIVEEILYNSQQGQFEFSERVIVPAVYHIYLHPEDLDRLKPVERVIREECKSGLNKRLRQLNRKRFGRTPVQYGIQAQDWEIQVLADYHDDAATGSVKVVSSLAPAEESEFVGTVTVRVKGSAAARTPSASVSQEKDGRETKKTSGKTAIPAQQTWGTLSWRDDEGDKTFPLAAAVTNIGRGSQMDVVIRNASEDVSRKHCIIALDPSGKAAISDAGSSNGTLIDGVLLTPNVETPLPDASRISLANGVVILNFTRRGV